ncbi:MAG: response regulator [Gemmatimonadetes bacterium]|nr:response regulator [Gemmatimonadota bacterium]
MSTTPVIQHWLVPVARGAGLLDAVRLHVDSGTAIPEAWRLVALAAGVDEDELADHVARHYRLGRADPWARDAHAHRLLPASLARRLHVVPLRYTDRSLVVATADPVSMEAEREIAHVSSRTVHFEVAAPAAIETAIVSIYPEEEEQGHEVHHLLPEERGGPHVLVVDDDPGTRLLLRTILQERDFRVTEAADGVQALAVLDGPEAVHLVTLDLMMPEMDGIEVLRRIRSRVRTAGLPVIVATAKDDPEVEVELFEAGADDFVVKPIDPPRFILRIQAVLRRRSGSLRGTS